MNYGLHTADCVEFMQSMEPCSVDSIVCDPPYELGFMGKRWDSTGVAFNPETWRSALRVLKPGGHMLAFGGTRTMHRIVCAIEDAGFEIRDTLMWIYGSGFPKSLDVSKAIDKAAGAERQPVGPRRWAGRDPNGTALGRMNDDAWEAKPDCENGATAPATDAARQWQGWGTALKPAFEPIVLARKPLEGTVAANVQAHGVGGINVDGCRVEGAPPSVPQPKFGVREDGVLEFGSGFGRNGEMSQATGRWPANIIHDGSEEVTAMFPANAPSGGVTHQPKRSGFAGFKTGRDDGANFQRDPDNGSAARFFYCAKASKKDRSDGNNHPTVKPNALMRYLCRLVTPPGGVVLDPFMGSGSTGVAAMQEGFRFIGIDMDPSYTAIAYKRIEEACK